MFDLTAPRYPGVVYDSGDVLLFRVTHTFNPPSAGLFFVCDLVVSSVCRCDEFVS